MRAVAQFMSEWWLVPIGLLVLIGIGIALGKVLISDRKLEAFYGFAALVIAIVLVPQVWMWIADTGKPTNVAPPVSASSGGSITLPPRGRSGVIPIPVSWTEGVRARGHGFLSHYVYQDGRECTFGNNCPDGFHAVYFTNTTDAPNVVEYGPKPK